MYMYIVHSTMSTSLNSVAATLFEDYIKPLLPWKPNDKQSNFIMKTIVIVAGIISSALVFVVAKMGTIMQVIMVCFFSQPIKSRCAHNSHRKLGE